MKSLSNLSVVFFLLLFLISCGKKESGQLVGVQDRPKWGGFNPFGMVYVPSGTLTIGQSDQDVFSTYNQRQKNISITGFFMDDTEITNNEYRQFVEWVKDSIAHEMMGNKTTDDYDNEVIDWEVELDYSDETLNDMYYQGDMAFDGQREFNKEALKYKYSWLDWQKAAHDKKATRKSLIQKAEVTVWPDEMCWIRDFTYSYNEPQTRNYFTHPAFDDYPVVGVTWKQATAFCNWRTKLWNKYKGENEPNTEEFRLPSESEWEYAARGGKEISPYPWGGPYIRNAKGCLLANFKPGRGNYPEDGGLHTVKADAYFPNDYGLYCMAGNVSEWCRDAFHENAYRHQHDLNPDYRYDAKDDDPEAYKRKVIRGGSWKDISYYCQTGTRSWEFQDTSKSYLGFRCVITYLGRSINDF
ncbi:MAG: SUMF1/EgtB/PvdO family nonheme iron enzyme [Saprospiraceae bacterium]|jgi:sulfatase modifying factor 1|nr:SUMF1/EgtB/PvdO family nonheme iron enzyme [Saprospiraceae bacterium]MBK9565013.1 SUMF1/EgtB/PvdO family nonheme iron enzyme [Saprospiraceae bacterium]MBP6447442.1 SUMF1/EgtB/PvdO family nonheme iron enzyme [Saprospiraceae bacterium]